jgi:hypothetical protein
MNKAIKIGRIEKIKSKIMAGEIKRYGAFLFADFILFSSFLLLTDRMHVFVHDPLMVRNNKNSEK